MIGDAALSQKVADRLLALGIYVIGFFYPVVPQGPPVSELRSPPHIRKKTYNLRYENSPKFVKNTGLRCCLWCNSRVDTKPPFLLFKKSLNFPPIPSMKLRTCAHFSRSTLPLTHGEHPGRDKIPGRENRNLTVQSCVFQESSLQDVKDASSPKRLSYSFIIGLALFVVCLIYFPHWRQYAPRVHPVPTSPYLTPWTVVSVTALSLVLALIAAPVRDSILFKSSSQRLSRRSSSVSLPCSCWSMRAESAYRT